MIVTKVATAVPGISSSRSLESNGSSSACSDDPAMKRTTTTDVRQRRRRGGQRRPIIKREKEPEEEKQMMYRRTSSSAAPNSPHRNQQQQQQEGGRALPSPPPPTATPPPQRRHRRVKVRFSTTPDIVGHVPARTDISESMKRDLYITPDNLKKIRSEAKLITKYFRHKDKASIIQLDKVFHDVMTSAATNYNNNNDNNESSLLQNEKNGHQLLHELAMDMNHWCNQSTVSGRGLEKYCSTKQRMERIHFANECREATLRLLNNDKISDDDVSTFYHDYSRSATLLARVMGHADELAVSQQILRHKKPSSTIIINKEQQQQQQQQQDSTASTEDTTERSLLSHHNNNTMIREVPSPPLNNVQQLPQPSEVATTTMSSSNNKRRHMMEHFANQVGGNSSTKRIAEICSR